MDNKLESKVDFDSDSGTGDIVKKKEKKKKSTEEKRKERKVIFWFFVVMIVISLLFGLKAKMTLEGEENIPKNSPTNSGSWVGGSINYKL